MHCYIQLSACVQPLTATVGRAPNIRSHCKTHTLDSVDTEHNRHHDRATPLSASPPLEATHRGHIVAATLHRSVDQSCTLLRHSRRPSSTHFPLPQRQLQQRRDQQLSEQSLHQPSHIYPTHQSPYLIHIQPVQGELAPISALSVSSAHLPSQSLPVTAYPPPQHVPSFPVSASPPLPPFIDQSTVGPSSSAVLSELHQLQRLSHHLSIDQLSAFGVDQQTIAALVALNSAFAPLPTVPLTSTSASSSPPPFSVSSSSPTASTSAMSYKSDYSKRHRDGDSSGLQKRSKVESHATTPSSTSDTFSPSSSRRRRVMDRSGDDEDRLSDSGGSDNDSDGSNGSETADDSPLPSSSTKKRSEEDKVRNELQRKRQHQKSDKQRRAKIKDGMEQLKALVSLHGKLESPDQASIVSASVDLVHALRQEIAGLKGEVERTRGENAAMKQRGLAGYAGLDAVMRGQLGALGQSPLGQLQLSQLSSLQALNSQLSSLNQQQQAGGGGGVSQQQLSGLNTLNNINMLSSLGLPTNINASAQYQPAASQHHQHNQHSQQSGQPHQGIHSPLPMMPMQSPPPLSMPASHGSNGFTSQFLTHSPPATGMMYGKEWQ